MKKPEHQKSLYRPEVTAFHLGATASGINLLVRPGPLGSKAETEGMLKQRAHDVRAAIDPKGTLPSIELVTDPSKPQCRGSLVPQDMLIMQGDQQIGGCRIMIDSYHRVRWFNGINVGDNSGKGYGIAAYVAAIEQAVTEGYSFSTHGWSQTEGAKRIWEGLAEDGIARIVQPFEPDGNGKGRFIGEYVVDVLPAMQQARN